MKRCPRLLCESDNITPCPVRIVAAIAMGIYHFGIIYVVGVEHTVVAFSSLSDYLKDMAILVGATGPAIGLKSYMHGDAPQQEDVK